MAQLSDLQDFVREQTLLELDDWSNAKLTIVINEGINEVATRFNWPFLADTADFSTVADQQAYTYATIVDTAGTSKNIGKIHVIVDTEYRRRLSEMSSEQAWAMYGGSMPEGDPTHFFLWGDTVNLVPVPQASETDRLRIYYFRRPDQLSDPSDVPEWDPQFHYIPAYWACSRAWEREEDFEKAAVWRQQFDARVETMGAYYLNRAEDKPIVVGLGRRDYQERFANVPWINGVSG